MTLISRQNETNAASIELHAATMIDNRIIVLLRCETECRMIDASDMDLVKFTSAERLRAWNQAQAGCNASSISGEVPT